VYKRRKEIGRWEWNGFVYKMYKVEGRLVGKMKTKNGRKEGRKEDRVQKSEVTGSINSE
jgi:hypothetical protein